MILFFDLWRDKRWYFSSKISHILSCRKREDFAYRIQILDKKCDDIRHKRDRERERQRERETEREKESVRNRFLMLDRQTPRLD